MDHEKRLVFAIGRQYGSCGTEIGRKLSEELGIHFYDKNILRMTSDESGIKESYFHLADEKAGSKLLYKIIDNLTPEIKEPSFGSDLVTADNLFRFQSTVIQKLAAEESFVIMGRCAGHVLEGIEGVIRVFVYADLDSRIKRITDQDLYDPKDVKKNVRRIDRERRDYHRYYAGKDWEDVSNYDLMIDSTKLGIDGSIRLIREYAKISGYNF